MLIRTDSWLDRLILRTPRWLGHYATTRIGTDCVSWRCFTFRRPK